MGHASVQAGPFSPSSSYFSPVSFSACVRAMQKPEDKIPHASSHSVPLGLKLSRDVVRGTETRGYQEQQLAFARADSTPEVSLIFPATQGDVYKGSGSDTCPVSPSYQVTA